MQNEVKANQRVSKIEEETLNYQNSSGRLAASKSRHDSKIYNLKL